MMPDFCEYTFDNRISTLASVIYKVFNILNYLGNVTDQIFTIMRKFVHLRKCNSCTFRLYLSA